MNQTAEAGCGDFNPPDVAQRLSDVHVGVREDLEVTRHLFHGQPSYVVRDPMTFRTYRLDPNDYSVFVAIDRSRSLGEIFEDLVARGVVSREHEQKFYQFILTLHRLNFLNLPISDAGLLYQRSLARKRARRSEKLFGFLFLRIPLVNPDAFLERTVRYVRFVFSRWFFGLWLCFTAAALFVASRNFEQLLEPLQGVLTARNLPLMWIALVVLKVMHEFGHAYACKRLGGYVPEMGVYLIVFTPCAYVDATAAWGFNRKWDRLVVCLAGVYVESIVAILALFVWTVTLPGLLHDVAYNVMFLASAVTVLFNINPLVRFDGYYVLSDLAEVPNLRQRSVRYVTDVLKHIALGVPIASGPNRLIGRALMLAFGVAASVYRTVVVLAISALVATKMFALGMVLAATFLINMIIAVGRRLISYLWFAEETARVRTRAVTMSLLVLVGLPAAILFLPIRSDCQAYGVIGTEHELVVRPRIDGFVRTIRIKVGQHVKAGDVLVELASDACHEALAEASAQLEASAIRLAAYEAYDPAVAWQERQRHAVYKMELDRRKSELADLAVRAEAAGHIVECLLQDAVGRYVRKAEPVAIIASGRWQVRAVLAEVAMADAQPAVGDMVQVRVAAVPGRTLRGRIARIAPAGSRNISTASLTQIGGGDIAVNPMTWQAEQPYVEVTIDLLDEQMHWLRHGMTCQVRFRGGLSTLGAMFLRRCIRFVNGLLQQ